MKILVTLALLVFSFQSFALIKVGDKGACANLTVIQQNGQEIQKNTCESENKNGFVLLDFVSATCTYCIGSLPDVAQFTSEMRGELTVRQIGIDRNPDLLREYWTEHKVHMVFDLALDSNRVLKNAYQVTAVPSYVLLDGQQNVLFVNVGTLDAKQFSEIKRLVRGN